MICVQQDTHCFINVTSGTWMIDNCELMKHMNAGMYVASSHKGRLEFQLLDVLIVTR